MSKQFLSYIVDQRCLPLPDTLTTIQKQILTAPDTKAIPPAADSIAQIGQLMKSHRSLSTRLQLQLVEFMSGDFQFEMAFVKSQEFAVVNKTFAEQLKAADANAAFAYYLYLATASRTVPPGQELFDIAKTEAASIFKRLSTITDHQQLIVNLQILSRFARNQEIVAALFVENKQVINIDFFKNLVQIVHSMQQNFYPAVLYQTLLLLWQLSFESRLINSICNEGVHSLLTRTLGQRDIQSQGKIVRVSLLLLNSLLQQNSEAVQQIISVNGIRLFTQLKNLTWPADSNIESMIDSILELLNTSLTDMSTIDMYKQELLGKILQMTPLHTNSTFWKQYANDFTNDGAFLLRKLTDIAQNAVKEKDFETLQVFLNDITAFINAHPKGREWCNKIPNLLLVALDCMKLSEKEDIVALAVGAVGKLLLSSGRAI